MSVVFYPNANSIKITGKVNINFQFPPSFQFVGTQEIIVKDIARATQYSFVQIDLKTIEKMILVQHEMFLPQKDGYYNYQSKDIVSIGGINWRRNNFIFDQSTNLNPKSDTYQLRNMLKSMNYIPLNQVMNNRIVYVSPANNREEILLVYAEDLKFSGFQIDDFYDGDEIKDSKLWNNVIEPLQERAMTVLQTV